jgi:putative endonuclease
VTHGGWVYMMSNRPNGTLYLGVTSDLVRRVWEHRSGQGSRFVQRYYLKRIVWFEHYADIETAIQRETSLKRWPREWKVALINKENPGWDDLYPRLL